MILGKGGGVMEAPLVTITFFLDKFTRFKKKNFNSGALMAQRVIEQSPLTYMGK